MGDFLIELSKGGATGELILAIIRILLIVVTLLTLVPGLIWWERRLLSWMQDRIGPNRSGTITFPDRFPLKGLAGKKIRTFGLLQPILDGVKLFMKEDITPNAVDRLLYFTAPALALFPAFALAATIPWGPTGSSWSPENGFYNLLTPIADVEIGILYVLAISSLGAYGVVLAGYASNNKYSLMGALRAAAQLISYELSMAMGIAIIVLASGTMKLSGIVSAQEAPLWGSSWLAGVQNWFIFTPFGFLAAIIFLIAMIAETNRAPFDLPEAENELIAGYHTEYSSMKFAVFFMGEYAAMFVLSGVFACLFLGGYNFLPFNFEYLFESTGNPLFSFLAGANYWLAPLTFLLKCAGGISFFIWLRATLPRLRYDQLMSLGWKTLLPTSVGVFIITGLWIVLTDPLVLGLTGGWIATMLAFVLGIVVYLNIQSTMKKSQPNTQTRTVEMVSQESRRTVTMVDPSKAN